MDKNIYNIASDYFRGQISENDLNFLESWLKQLPENKLLFNELKKIWELTGDLNNNLTPDVDAEWNLFVKNRNKTSDRTILKIGKRIEFRKLLKIAAVIIPAFAFLSISLLYLNNKINTPKYITINTTIEKKECVLPDGSKVMINKNSTFVYPDKFLKNERTVKLEGEAFFEVVKGKASFKIITDKTQILVVGTAFNVRAYDQDQYNEVVVSRGTVVFKDKLSDENSVLNAGEKGTFNEQTKEIIKEKLKDFNAIGWKDEYLSFQDTPLNDIETIINRYFDIQMQVDPSMKQCKFTGEFKQPKLEEILDVISISLGAKYQIDNDTIFLKGQGCKN